MQSKRAVCLIVLAALFSGCSGKGGQVESDSAATLEQIRPLAQELFDDFARKNPEKLQIGPCLGLIGNSWSVDIAHSPRIPTDNNPENQCTAYQKGQAQHLIEFNPNGQIITIK